MFQYKHEYIFRQNAGGMIWLVRKCHRVKISVCVCLCGVEAEAERPKRDAGRESSPFSPEALLMFYLSGVAKQAVFNLETTATAAEITASSRDLCTSGRFSKCVISIKNLKPPLTPKVEGDWFSFHFPNNLIGIVIKIAEDITQSNYARAK